MNSFSAVALGAVSEWVCRHLVLGKIDVSWFAEVMQRREETQVTSLLSTVKVGELSSACPQALRAHVTKVCT